MVKLKFDGGVRDSDSLSRFLKSASWTSRVNRGLCEIYRQQAEPCIVTARFETLAVYGCVTIQGQTRIEPTHVWGASSRLKLYQADFVLAVQGVDVQSADELIDNITCAAVLVVAQVAVLTKKSMRQQARTLAECAKRRFPELPLLLR